MKNLSLFLVLLVFLLVFIHAEITGESVTGETVTGESVTGETVTGEATTHGLSMGIYVVAGAPSLQIILPVNGTYLTNESIPLNYSASNYDSIWYNLGEGQNYSLSGNTTFNTTEGIHTLYLYANNTQGNTSKNVTFFVNLTKFFVNYSNWFVSGKSSTDFNKSSYEELQNIDDVFFKSDSHGAISFLEAINITQDSNTSDNLANLNNYISISSNYIEIDTENLPNFNKSAALCLYGLSFSNPRVLRDGAVCSSSICSEVNYSSGTFCFNVTQFTSYSAEETPVSETPGGGGGGGGGTKTIYLSEKEVLITPEEIFLSLKQGETDKQEILIQNNFSQELNFSVEFKKIGSFVKASEEKFLIKSKQNKTITLDFIARDDTEPNLYLGSIIFKTPELEKRIILALEVKEKKSLFDVSINLPKRFETSYPGEEMFFSVDLINLGANEREDILLETSIQNTDGEIVFSGEESFAVQTTAEHVVEITLPSNLEEGKYFISVRAKYSGGIAVASKDFLVKNRGKYFFISSILLLSLIVLLLIYLILKRIKSR